MPLAQTCGLRSVVQVQIKCFLGSGNLAFPTSEYDLSSESISNIRKISIFVACFNPIVCHVLLLASSYDDTRIVRFWTIKFAICVSLPETRS